MCQERLTHYIANETVGTSCSDLLPVLKEVLADIVACTIAGTQAKVAQIAKRFAFQEWQEGNSTVFLSKKRLSATGATWANATMANALDVDDGHRLTKGHPGAVVFPAILAAAEDRNISGKAFINALLVSYEIGIRAGILSHQLRPEYHCTGSWGAIGAAAGVSRIIGLTPSQILNALGIAEYHSTYSPMMRCIDHPSMVKDGIGWGSMTGISSAYLASFGYTGIPSLFSTEQAKTLNAELGRHVRLKELYHKPYACCRWAQPAIAGIKYLQEYHGVTYTEVDHIVIYTFEEASRLSWRPPKSTEEAQYNLVFPVISYLVFGEVGPKQVLRELKNRQVRDLMSKVEVVACAALDEKFPKEALSQVEVQTVDGHRMLSPVLQAKGDYDYPLTSEEKRNKFIWLVEPLLGTQKSQQLLDLIWQIDEVRNIRELTAMLSG